MFRFHLTAVTFSCALVGLAGAQEPAAVSSAAGAPESAQCLKCHSAVAQAIERGGAHAPARNSCGDCHVPKEKAVAAHQLKKAEPGLCLECHPADSEKLAAAHQGQPFATSVCTNCHDPHASKARKLIYESAHGPFAGRRCDECHSTPEDGKVRLIAAKVSEICFTCHVQLKNRVEEAKSRHQVVVSGACTECHTPHASRFAHHLRRPEEKTCQRCHTGAPHEGAESNCASCHDAHASTLPHLVKAVER